MIVFFVFRRENFCFLTFFLIFLMRFVLTSVRLYKLAENCVLRKSSLFLIFLKKLRINIDQIELPCIDISEL